MSRSLLLVGRGCLPSGVRAAMVVAAGTALSLLAVAPVRAADIIPQACPIEETYEVWSPQKVWISTDTASDWQTGPGSIDFTGSGTIDISVTTSASFSVSAGALVASAETTFGVDLTVGSSHTTSWSHSIPLSSGVTSRLVRTKEGRLFGFRKHRLNTNCTATTSADAVAYAPLASHSSNYYCWKRDDYPATAWWYPNPQGGC
ncbi:hypothetical protein [Solwaraspora sp. WMMD792]|uniref:hypothetical protein n=1 Tax=Solwaraspora sp. WMMD792 TaxID=3016099 RepID=UPI002417E6F7|nr:hypothetical protein [Solwaraspora sp. WMMD792]MDG4773910.1 hypothetical protein [Solwaraspora sp. WMMD792]